MTGGFRSRSTKGDRPKKPKPTAAPSGRRPRRPSASGAGSAGAREPKLPTIDPPRRAALDVLRRVSEDGAYANLTLPALLRERKIRGRDAAFATELTYGTLRMRGVLDRVLGECATRPLGEVDPQVLDILRLGAYQLLCMRVDDHAAVDTSVRLTVISGLDSARGFVNAILRAVSRTPAEVWLRQLAPDDPWARVAWQSAHPEWIARSFGRSLGLGAEDEELRRALEADSDRPTVHLVARPGEMSAEELALIAGGTVGRYSPYAVYLPDGNPGDVEPVRHHLAGVQDEGSQLIARAFAAVPVPEDAGRWLDLCAGPGGKAALIGALARIDGARLDAIEVSEHRARLVEQAVTDLPVTVRVADGRDSGLEAGYDRILVDAPCSGLGALRRRPEARWRKAESDIAELSALQSELLAEAIRLAHPGGVVIYSTCSPDLRETREVVDRAIAAGGVVEEDAHGYVEGMSEVGDFPSVQMWPHRHGTDAMFFAVLRRR